MATRIRLQRHGKKNKAFFHLVAADSREKRDGKFIEKLGTYNPNTNPATIDINFEKTIDQNKTYEIEWGKLPYCNCNILIIFLFPYAF